MQQYVSGVSMQGAESPQNNMEEMQGESNVLNENMLYDGANTIPYRTLYTNQLYNYSSPYTYLAPPSSYYVLPNGQHNTVPLFNAPHFTSYVPSGGCDVTYVPPVVKKSKLKKKTFGCC